MKYGEGGAPQYYIKKIDELIANGYLKRTNEIKLNNTKITYSEFNQMMKKIK